MTEIADGIFVFSGARETFSPANLGLISNMGFIVGSEAVAVIDTGGSRVAAERLRQAIAERTLLPVRYVINTHMHPDHVFGNAAFSGDGATFVGHARLARALQARAAHYVEASAPLLGAAVIGDIEIIPPDIGVSETLDIDLGNRKLVLMAHATAHTDNDLSVFDVTTGTLFAGDLVFADHLPVIDGSILGWLGVLEDLRALPAQRIVPGHGPASLPWPAGADAQLRYLNRIAAEVRQTIADGGTLAEAMETVGRAEADNWALFDAFNARNVAAAFAELEWE